MYIKSDNRILNEAARIAKGDIDGNCLPYRGGLLTDEKLCVMAGLDYGTPWTRDAAINTMNALCIMNKDIAKNTLLSVCEEVGGKTRIGGEYWDAIIWAIGAWQYYLVNTEASFLEFAADVICNSLERFEKEEYDEEWGLFRGQAVYGDGISAYPDKYAERNNHASGMEKWPIWNADKRAKKGFGIPFMTLSTNCVYYAAYVILGKMYDILGQDKGMCCERAEALKQAINRHFWNEETGRYDYLIDDEGKCSHMEALGLAFVMLFGIADDERCASVLENTFVTEHGIACVWPTFERYQLCGGYGRHSGTIWPHAQGYWALAALKSGKSQAFDKEFYSLAYKAVRDTQFAEIYHPITGEIYGGIQEQTNYIKLWDSCRKQTWSATAFWAMIYYGIFGFEYSEKELKVNPYLPKGIDLIELKQFAFGEAEIKIRIERNAGYPSSLVIPKDIKGKHQFVLGV